jgi:thiol-disulfide isomerase/thioredoxin
MRFPRLLPCLLIGYLGLGLCGCAQPWNVRKAQGDGVKTVASIGEKPLPIRSGIPEESVRADDTPTDLPAPSPGRISGRVYDEKGRPVPNARVRLAVGGESGGKAVSSITDNSGAFTLRGLRPGSSYTVIAEYQGKTGMMTGRVDVEAPDANVRIGLHRRDSQADDRQTFVRPARPSVAPISEVRESDEDPGRPDEADRQAPRANREDIDPIAQEAEEVGRTNPGSSPRLSVADGPSSAPATWKGRYPAAGGGREKGQLRANRPRPEDGGSPARRPPTDEDEEGENPLPPAIESDAVGATLDDQRPADRPVLLARGEGSAAPRGPSARTSRAPDADSADFGSRGEDDDSPRPLPQAVVGEARTISPEAYAPILMGDPAPPAREPVRPTVRRSPKDGVGVRPSSENPPAAKPRPTWGELSFQKPAIPLDETLQRASRTIPAGKTASARSAGLLQGTGVACEFDASERQVYDFRLPALGGRMVSFRELDSDLVLLDFWGTWCAPCRKSIPHLNELQKTLGGKRLQVVGIACERVPAKDRDAKVAAAVKDLKIAYPVLTTTMDGTCPVQEAFQIQFYPTMILLDRQGRVLRREEGATDSTLARMDRFIARNLNLAERSGEASQLARDTGRGK